MVGSRGEADHRWFGEEEEKKRHDASEEKKERTGMSV